MYTLCVLFVNIVIPIYVFFFLSYCETFEVKSRHHCLLSFLGGLPGKLL